MDMKLKRIEHQLLQVTNWYGMVSVQTRADKIAAETLPEVMEHSVAVLLVHLSVNVETRVA